MYARILRKWSLAKFLMNLWLPVIMLLVIWCQNATSMHLLTNTRSSIKLMPTTIDIGSTMTINDPYRVISDYHPYDGDDRPQQQQQQIQQSQQVIHSNADDHNLNPFPYAILIRTSADTATTDNVPHLNSQIINLNSNSNSHNSKNNNRKTQQKQQHHSSLTRSANIEFLDSISSKQKRHVQHSYNSNTEVKVHERFERVSNPLPISSSSLQQSPAASSSSTTSLSLTTFDPTRPRDWLQLENDRRLRIERHRQRLLRSNADAIRDDRSASDQKIDAPLLTPPSSSIPHQLKIHNSPKNSLNRTSRYYRRRRTSRSHAANGNRRRPKRYCSARDPLQLAYRAPIVLEGKVRSMSVDRRANFSVSFEVTRIFKNKLTNYNLRKSDLVRLQFTYRNTTGECDIYQEQFRARGFIKLELQNAKNYVLFLEQYAVEKFKIIGQPIMSTQRVFKDVMNAVREKFGTAASIRLLKANKHDKVREGEELRIICRVRGDPPPKVTWFKDDKSIKRNRHLYQFVHLKRRSELIVRSFSNATAGLYECRAKNNVSKKVEKKTIRIEAYGRPEGHNDTGVDCIQQYNTYCLNGGSCKYFLDIHQYYCKCADGFEGDRCQEKRPTNVTLSMYPSKICGRSTYYGESKC